MRDVSIIGVSMTRFAKRFGISMAELGCEAAVGAMKDAGVNRTQLEAVHCGNIFLKQPGQAVMDQVGVSGVPVFNHENACASGSAAFYNAWLAVASGAYDMVLAIGAESMTSHISGLIAVPEGESLDFDSGLTAPMMFGQVARLHMEKYGTTHEQMAKIAQKNHDHSTKNPFAQYQKSFPLEEILASRLVADPLTLLECCPIGDGAAAAVLCSDRVARKFRSDPVHVKSAIFTSGEYQSDPDPDVVELKACRVAGAKAYEIAGIGPQDLDVLECHDCFSFHELLVYEDLGLCEKGMGGVYIDENRSGMNGDVVFNTSGGLLSKGHPIGATGVGMIVEIVWQLRGQATGRQVEGAKVGLTHNGGGGTDKVSPGSMSINILTV